MANQKSNASSCPQRTNCSGRIRSAKAHFCRSALAAADKNAYISLRDAIARGFALSKVWEEDISADIQFEAVSTMLEKLPDYRFLEELYVEAVGTPIEEGSWEQFSLRSFAAKILTSGLAVHQNGGAK